MSTNAQKMLTHTPVTPTQNVSIIKVYDYKYLPSFHLYEGECVDDHECTNNNNDYHESRAVCTYEAKTYTVEWVNGVAKNTMSGRGFSCACIAGYSNDNEDGTVCSDGDACLNDDDNICNANADYLNTTGSYECICKAQN